MVPTEQKEYISLWTNENALGSGKRSSVVTEMMVTVRNELKKVEYAVG